MQKKEHINPMLNADKKPLRIQRKRKTRSDKKADIRVPISAEDRAFILYNARSKRQSMTAFCTDIVRTQLQQTHYFYSWPYEQSDHNVHIKADADIFQQIVQLSADWDCSLRAAAYRILTDSIFYIRGGVHIDGIQ